MSKSIIREKMIHKIEQLTLTQKKEIENILFQKVIETNYWQQAEIIGLTASLPHEWNTSNLIQYGLNNNKIIALPKADPKTKSMTFYQINHLDQLVKGYAGILEPDSDLCPMQPISRINLMIVPGIAYDKKGFRIGFGGGFYDRLLEHYHGSTLSIAAQFQITCELPITKYDQKVKLILTEQNTYKF